MASNKDQKLAEILNKFDSGDKEALALELKELELAQNDVSPLSQLQRFQVGVLYRVLELMGIKYLLDPTRDD